MRGVIGVGLIGAGPVSQAIHLPVLEALDGFEVRHISDVNIALAQTVAEEAGARWSASHQALVEDPEVDVVVVGSPPQFHVEQVLAACAAGKRAVLCEKPLATDPEGARLIAEASRATGVPVLVGAMHTFDPVVLAALTAWDRLDRAAELVRLRVYIPPNARFEDAASQLVRPAPSPSSPSARRDLLHGLVTGLAVHDLPLVRHFAPNATVTSARLLDPLGYLISAATDSCKVQLIAHITDCWQPEWTLDVHAGEAHLHLDFPPSYVSAGSARADLLDGGGTTSFPRVPLGGYQAEWLAVAAAATSGDTSGLRSALDDADFTFHIADEAANLVGTA